MEPSLLNQPFLLVRARRTMVVAAADATQKKNESSSPKTATTTKKSKKGKKKRRRVSKHIVNSGSKTTLATTVAAAIPASQQQQNETRGGGSPPTSAGEDGGGDVLSSRPPVAASSAKKRSKDKHVKDPKEAMAYLEQWKVARGEWKFNKNTQSWLIRHMYDAALVPKHTFQVLLEYLHDCHDDGKKRLCLDATQRAVRYQRHVEGGASDNATSKNHDDRQKDETYRKMDEHDKRKEYKRARKLLDAIHQPVSSSS
jgi:WKF domain